MASSAEPVKVVHCCLLPKLKRATILMVPAQTFHPASLDFIAGMSSSMARMSLER